MLILLCLFFINASGTTLELEELLKELSWTLRLKLFKEMTTTTSSTTTTTPALTHKIVTNTSASKANETESRRLVRSPTRRVGVESLVTSFDGDEVVKRRQLLNDDPNSPTEPISADENNMRLKLFRLMYETVRDSDLKVKRAELIQEHYTNMSSFQIGYLMGDVTDKFTIMTDISTTLNRFYAEWKPIEHINAYEQIANQAIEISHLIDLIKMASKRDVPPSRRRAKS